MGCAGSRAGCGSGTGRCAVRAAIESMNGARFVHDTLERCGWEVEVADAQKVKGLAPLACKTDRIDAWVLAELSRRDLVPAIWLPSFEQRARARTGALAAVPGPQALLAQAPDPRAAVRVRAHAARCQTCSAAKAASCSPAWTSPSRGAAGCSPRSDDRRSRPQITEIDRELKALGADHPTSRR